MAIVLALAGTFVYLRVAANLDSTIDDGLRTRADELASTLAGSRPGALELGQPGAEGGEDVLTQILTPAGGVVGSSEGPDATSVLDSSQLASAGGGLTYFDPKQVEGVEGEARLLAGPAAGDGRSLIAVVGASTSDRDETLSGLIATFSIGAPIALLISSALGYALASAALRPVEAMRVRAQEITLERRGERLPLPPSEDEVNRLGRTLNEMLERIEGSLERERAFVADASHELRTPLGLLRAELELGSRPDRDLEEARAAMSSAIEEADRLRRLADDLLVLDRSDGGGLTIERGEVPVGGLLERTRARFAARAEEEGREISVNADGGLTASLDPARVEAALSNLVDNALRHGSGEVRLAGRADRDALVLEVSDAGAGFPAAFVPKAFDRFSRAETGRTTGGTGLGLAIVKAIAEAHGGDVSIEATGPGSTVAIRFPAEEAGSAAG